MKGSQGCWARPCLLKNRLLECFLLGNMKFILVWSKKHEMQSSVCMNGNLLLFGYQGTDKQAKMRLYAEEIQSINKEDVIKSL